MTLENGDNPSEYTLFCGKKIAVTKAELDYFTDILTPPLEPCHKKCPDKKVRGRVNRCPTFLNVNKKITAYTLPCGKIIPVTCEDDYLFSHEPLEACSHRCPDKKIGGDVNNCEEFLKADAEEYADDPTYQEYIKAKTAKSTEPKADRHHQKTKSMKKV